MQRPTAPRQIESDLKLMASAARVVRERVRQLDFIDANELVDEFGRSIRLELDYQQEARNAETFRRNFAGDDRIAVPRVWWRYTTSRLLTLDRLHGVHVRDLDLDAWAAGGPAVARVHDDGRVDDDDLPARVLPRRPASREHPPSRGRAARSRRLRSRRAAHGDRHVPPHAALRRRRDGERRRAAAAARRARRPVSRATARTSCGRASRSSTTATTAHGSRTSTRSRRSAKGSRSSTG